MADTEKLEPEKPEPEKAETKKKTSGVSWGRTALYHAPIVEDALFLSKSALAQAVAMKNGGVGIIGRTLSFFFVNYARLRTTTPTRVSFGEALKRTGYAPLCFILLAGVYFFTSGRSLFVYAVLGLPVLAAIGALVAANFIASRNVD